MEYSVSFPGGEVNYLLNAGFQDLEKLVDKAHCILITDSNVADIYRSAFSPYKTVIIPAGEEYKTWQTVENLSQQLMLHKAHRKSFIVGAGGGMTTDIAGFLASVYMRGIPFGFVPTSLLAMVDAAIGGKNGINVGLQKNFLGTVQHPKFILYDTAFLKTLPAAEWSNGFAEVIKYALLFDAALVEELLKNNIDHYKQDAEALQAVISKCAAFKNKIVKTDEKETGVRKLLNFGHTAGHAFETLYHIPHGHAVGLGMIVACFVSEDTACLDPSVREILKELLHRYELPDILRFDTDKVTEVLSMDKKRSENELDYIVLEGIAVPAIKTLSFDIIHRALEKFNARNR